MWGNLPDAALLGEVLKRIDDLKARQDAMASGKLCCSTQHVFLFLDTFRVQMTGQNMSLKSECSFLPGLNFTDG